MASTIFSPAMISRSDNLLDLLIEYSQRPVR